LDWRHDLLSEVERVILRRISVFWGVWGDFTMDAAAAVAAGEWITAAGVFDGVANLAAKSLIAPDISGEVTFHRLLDTTPQDFLMLPHARTSKWTKGLGAIAELDGVRGWRRSPRQ
jgi:predicted ATPase